MAKVSGFKGFIELQSRLMIAKYSEKMANLLGDHEDDLAMSVERNLRRKRVGRHFKGK